MTLTAGLLEINANLGRDLDALRERLWTDIRRGGRGETTLFETFGRFAQRLAANVIDLVRWGALQVGQVVQTPDGPLTVARIDQVDADTTVLLTEDGLGVETQWHTGGRSEGVVRYERWTGLGRIAHGYVHPVTRRIVQTG